MKKATEFIANRTSNNLLKGETEPQKGYPPQPVTIGELKEGDHLMVKHTLVGNSKILLIK